MNEFETQLLTIDAGEWLEREPEPPDQIIEGVIDVGDKLAVIGSSKMRKTFFFLQLLICIAAGKPFLNWRIPKPRRVFHIQYEVQCNHYHRRVRRICRALGVTRADLGGRLRILNARGLKLTGYEGVEKIKLIAEPFKPEMISFDPLYKVARGVENSAEDTKIILNAFDELTEETGAACSYVHHDAKGFSGDRDIRDRGAGSNVLGRDYDACITLTPHVTEESAAVVEVLLRNYRPQKPFTALWTEDEETGGYLFKSNPDIVPTKRTSSNGKVKNQQPLSTFLPAAMKIVKNGPVKMAIFMDKLRTTTGLSISRSRDFRTWASSGNQPPLDYVEKRAHGFYEKLIGKPSDISRLKDLG